jgi:hypothetical protein
VGTPVHGLGTGGGTGIVEALTGFHCFTLEFEFVDDVIAGPDEERCCVLPGRPTLGLAPTPAPNAEGFPVLGKVADKDRLSPSLSNALAAELEATESLFESALLRKLAGLEFRSPSAFSEVLLLSYEGCFINGAVGGRRGICISFDMKLL